MSWARDLTKIHYNESPITMKIMISFYRPTFYFLRLKFALVRGQNKYCPWHFRTYFNWHAVSFGKFRNWMQFICLFVIAHCGHHGWLPSPWLFNLNLRYRRPNRSSLPPYKSVHAHSSSTYQLKLRFGFVPEQQCKFYVVSLHGMCRDTTLAYSPIAIHTRASSWIHLYKLMNYNWWQFYVSTLCPSQSLNSFCKKDIHLQLNI